MGENVQNLVVNYDLTSIQYDTEHMKQIASDLGFEEDELEKFGIHLEESRCNSGMCQLTPKNLKDLDKLLSTNHMTKYLKDKMMCHPVIKDQVVPAVQYVWLLFPCSLTCLECSPALEFIFVYCTPFCPISCPLYWLFFLFIALPQNIISGYLLGFCCPIIGIFLPCIMGLYYIVVPP